MNHVHSLRSYLFFKLLRRGQFGTLRVTTPENTLFLFGSGNPVISVKVNEWNGIERIVSQSDIGLAQAIMNGELVVDDEAALIAWVCNNGEALGEALQGHWYGLLFYQLAYWLKKNDRKQAKKNIRSHDKLGSEFYRLWIGPSLTYSCALFLKDDDNLETAQINKFKKIINDLDIRSSDHVLDLGCGSGGFFAYLAENIGCQITAVTNSAEQIRACKELIREKNISDKVQIIHADYRDVNGLFDKIISVEMLEAVGEDYWPTYFKKLRQLIKPKGKISLQTSTIKEKFFADYRTQPDFLQQYIFPGHILPTRTIVAEQAREAGLEASEPFVFSSSYIKTLQAWRKNFIRSLEDIRAMGFDEKFIRMWHFYFTYCEGTVMAGRADANQFILTPTQI